MPTPTRRIVVAANPEAAFGAQREAGSRAATLLEQAGFDVDLLIEADAPALVAAMGHALSPPRSIAALVVVGGDGMVNLGVEAVGDSKLPLGIVPAGTGNDLARGLGIPISDHAAAVERLVHALDAPARMLDAGLITRSDGSTMRFVGVFSGGFDALVNERANGMRWPKGRSRYSIAMLRELATLRAVDYGVELDGRISTRRGTLVAVANNSSFGGGMRVAPGAMLDDGLFDVVMLAPVSRTRLLGIFPRVFAGTHVTDARVSVERAARVRLDADRIVGYADGERVGPLPVTIEMLHRAWRVLA